MSKSVPEGTGKSVVIQNDLMDSYSKLCQHWTSKMHSLHAAKKKKKKILPGMEIKKIRKEKHQHKLLYPWSIGSVHDKHT